MPDARPSSGSAWPLIAVVIAALFGGVAVAAWVGGEVFLAAMGAIGCLMTRGSAA